MSRSWLSPQNWLGSSSSRGASRGGTVLFARGTRVVLEECSDPVLLASKSNLWDSGRRTGVIVRSEFSDPQKLDNDVYYMVALDAPLNTSPTDLERRLAPSLIAERLPGPELHLVAIRRSLLDRGIVIIKEDNYEFLRLPEDAMLVCQLGHAAQQQGECLRATPRRRLLLTCQAWNHYLCFEHLIPWDSRNDRPDLAITQMYHEQMVAHSLRQGLGSGFETRVLLGFNYWLEGAGTPEEQATAVREFSEYDKWVCKLCKDSKDKGNWQNTRFDEIHKQLFPNGVHTASFAANTASAHLLARCPGTYYDLVKRTDLSAQEIDYYVSMEDCQGNEEDADMLFMLIESARQSKPLPPASMRKGALSSNITALPQLTNSTTQAPVSLWLVCLETLSKVRISLKAESDYERLASAVLEALPVYASEGSHILLHCLQPDGSSKILSPLAVSALMRHVVGVEALKDGDAVVVRRGRVSGNVGARFSEMTALAVAPVLDDEEALMLRETINYLKERGYVGFKRIRGDGNCYYRAVIFGLIEQIVMHKQYLRFATLAMIFRRVKYDDESHQRQHHRLIIFLEENAAAASSSSKEAWGSRGGGGATPANVEQSFLLPDTDLDRAAIRACRSLVTAYMVSNADKEFNGIKMKDAILPLFEHEKDVVDMKSWCEKYVDRMDVDAEYHPQYGVLPHLLLAESCTIQNTEMMNHEVEQMRLDGYVEPAAARPSQDQRGRSSSSSSASSQSSSSEWVAPASPSPSAQRPTGVYRTESGTGTVSAFGRLHLLRRPGHYELLYHKECATNLETRDALLASCVDLVVRAAPAPPKGEGEGEGGGMRKRGGSDHSKEGHKEADHGSSSSPSSRTARSNSQGSQGSIGGTNAHAPPLSRSGGSGAERRRANSADSDQSEDSLTASTNLYAEDKGGPLSSSSSRARASSTASSSSGQAKALRR